MPREGFIPHSRDADYLTQGDDGGEHQHPGLWVFHPCTSPKKRDIFFL
ncbi:hypothetical protein SynMEDNS5_01811 [Synechococcus sp. MEDNS5]|nr:hypothetical protein SynMEDNS5_01811 [Synechococcus sp. MEDNS5]